MTDINDMSISEIDKYLITRRRNETIVQLTRAIEDGRVLTARKYKFSCTESEYRVVVRDD